MVKWKGTDISTYGIIVEKTPTISKGKKNIETLTIDGRSGFLTIDRGTYQPFNVSLECHAKEGSDFNQIKAFLDGYGTLSFENDKEYTAIINNAIPFEKVACFKSFIIQFLVNPIAHGTTEITKAITATPETFSISEATTEMTPEITIQGSGDIAITINNNTFNLTDIDSTKTYTLDSELKEIKDQNNNNQSSKMNGEFPKLKPASNTVSYTGTITTFTIKYKKAFL